jgi:hypothetical protein
MFVEVVPESCGELSGCKYNKFATMAYLVAREAFSPLYYKTCQQISLLSRLMTLHQRKRIAYMWIDIFVSANIISRM